MATLTRSHRKIMADDFVRINFGLDEKFELVDGTIHAMGGGSTAHARVQGDVYAFLHRALRGTGCRPYGPDMALQTMAHTVRYPDVTVYCGDPGREEQPATYFLSDPHVVIEVLSPSTRDIDAGRKLEEYQSLPSVCTIALIDPDEEWMRTFQRQANGRWDDRPEPQPDDLILPSLGITLPATEIFARD